MILHLCVIFTQTESIIRIMDHFNWFPVAAAGLSALMWYLYSRGEKSYKVPYLNETSFNPVFRITRPRLQRKQQLVETSVPNAEQVVVPAVEQVVEPVVPVPTTRELLFSILRNLNLEYTVDSDGDIFFRYQGEQFIVTAQDDIKYLRIQDLYWYDAPLSDIDNLSIVQKAINECNTYRSNVMVYNYRTDNNTINVHTLQTILWIPEIPSIEVYFTNILEDMLQTHQKFYQTMEIFRRKRNEQMNN